MEDWDRDPRMVNVALGFPLERELVEGECVRCVVPEHRGEGSVVRRGDGPFVYRCTCDKIPRSLPEVYIGRVTGVRRRHSMQDFILWHIRQAAMGKLIALPPVLMPPLPERCSEVVRSCYGGLKVMLRCRQLTALRDEGDFAFSRRSAAEWSGLSSINLGKDAIEGLIRLGILVVELGPVSVLVVEKKRYLPATRYRLGPGRTW